METKKLEHRIQQVVFGTVRNIINGFILERQSRGLSKRTIAYYAEKLDYFSRYLDELGVVNIEEVTPELIRQYLLYLSNSHNPGGIHTIYRAIRALFNWWESENDGGFHNPMRKVKAPKLVIEPLPGISIQSIIKMVDSCKTDLFQRDIAVLLTLVDTGARASELLSLNLDDINFITGAIQIKHAKGNKSRTVFIGKQCRTALRRYNKSRSDLTSISPLWITKENERLTLSGLRQIIRRRAKDAGIKEPGLHDFRRCFAITMLRNGCDLISLSRLMGHSSLEMLKRYLAIATSDCEIAHKRASPVDNLKL